MQIEQITKHISIQDIKKFWEIQLNNLLILRHIIYSRKFIHPLFFFLVKVKKSCNIIASELPVSVEQLGIPTEEILEFNFISL